MHSVTCFTHLQTFYTFPARFASRLSFPILASSTFSWLWWCNYFTLNFSRRKIFNARMLERKYIRARQKFYIEEMLSFTSFYNRSDSHISSRQGWNSSGWFYHLSYLFFSQYIFRYISAIFFPYASNEVTDCTRTFSVVLRGNFVFFSLRSTSSHSHDRQAYFCNTRHIIKLSIRVSRQKTCESGVLDLEPERSNRRTIWIRSNALLHLLDFRKSVLSKSESVYYSLICSAYNCDH